MQLNEVLKGRHNRKNRQHAAISKKPGWNMTNVICGIEFYCTPTGCRFGYSSIPGAMPQAVIVACLWHGSDTSPGRPPGRQPIYLKPLFGSGWIEMTTPDKPRSSKQKYRLTAKGEAVREELEGRLG